MHPFLATPGDPDMQRAIAENDPRHITRRRQKNNPKYHQAKIPSGAIRNGELKLLWHDAIHKSHNELYLVPESMAQPLNVCIRSATDATLTWRYDPEGPRQSARAYTRQRLETDPQKTRYLRVATRTEGAGNTYSTFVHPAIAFALLAREAHVPPGDVVARWNRAVARNDTEEAARMHTILRDGFGICVYFE